MPARWSRLHAALGLNPGELTYAMVERAVEDQVAEAEDLDWKRDLPPKVEEKLREFAKDVAAMANARGGLIIYGVAEDDGRAAAITGVVNNEGQRQRLRALAAQRVRPVVSGLEIFALDGETDQPGLVVVSVPASSDAPHIIGDQDRLGIPYRDGPETRWMSEHHLERAYADRLVRQRSDREALDHLLGEVRDQLSPVQPLWLMLAARPLAALPRLANSMEKERVLTLGRDALAVAHAVLSSNERRFEVLHSVDAEAWRNPKIGLRRWIVRGDHWAQAHERVEAVYIEIHYDGSSTFSVPLEKWHPIQAERGTCPVPTRVVECAIADGLSLASAHARLSGLETSVSLKLDLVRAAGEETPLRAVDDFTPIAGVRFGMAQVPGSRHVGRFVAVEAQVPATADGEYLREVARQVAYDCMHQFGVANLRLLNHQAPEG
jgi:Putative DNA-binding domain